MERAAIYLPALCAAILCGIAAQHAREGRSLSAVVKRRLAQGSDVFDLMEGPLEAEIELQALAKKA
eukprot:6769446-Alexandrium_andersonii.AAC.1